MWDVVAGGGGLGLSLRPQFVCCLIPTNNFDTHIMSKEDCGREEAFVSIFSVCF